MWTRSSGATASATTSRTWCGGASARAGGCARRRWPTSPLCRPRRSRRSGACSRGRRSSRPARPSGSSARCRTDTWPACSARCASSGSNGSSAGSEAASATVALVCQRLLRPGSKLSAARQFELTTLGEELEVAGAKEAELLQAMDWLLARQARIERALARRYLEPGGFVLYDLSSSYLEGSKCPLAAFGYSRDRTRGKPQITYGLTCSPRGRPVAIEVFGGGVHEQETLPEAAARLRRRFGIERVVFVGDRGLVKQAGVETLREHGFDWITALSAPQVQRLARRGELQLSLFD